MPKKVQNPRIPSKINDGLLSISSIDSEIHGSIHKTSSKFEVENIEDFKKIKSLVSSIKQNFNKNIADDQVINFWNSAFNNKFKENKNKATPKKKLENISRLIEKELEEGVISSLLASNSERKELYENYQMIFDSIPFLKKAVNIILNNILSPNDFTKKFLNVLYKGSSISGTLLDLKNSTESEDLRVIKNCKNMKDELNIECLIPQLLLDTLIKGDQFIYIALFKEEFDKFLNENISIEDDIFDIDNETILTEAEVLESFGPSFKNLVHEVSLDTNISEYKKIDDEFYEYIDESYGPFFIDVFEIKEKNIVLNENKLSQKLTSFLNNNIKFSSNRDKDLDTSVDEYKKDYNKHINKKNVRKPNSINISTDRDQNSSKKVSTDVPGIYLETIDPGKVITLEKNNFCYGYYIIENEDNMMGTGDANNPVSYKRYSKVSNQLTSSLNFRRGTKRNVEVDAINKFIDGFTSSVARKISKGSIAKNPEFKKIFYNIFKNEYDRNKSVRITYVPPNRMVHFKLGNEMYGRSVFASILFIAKIYLAILMNKFIGKVLRSSDRRVFYIEVGLDEDTESVVQSFIRDLKTKEFRMDNYKSINGILNYPGHFSDYYIPKIEGNSPIEIDTLQGMEEDVSGDSFLEYLERLLLSGSDVPSAMLNMVQDELEFAKTLTMQNGIFIRYIVNAQANIAPSLNKLIRNCYELTFDASNINLEDLEIILPTPTFLNMSLITEQMSASKEIIDSIAEVLVKKKDLGENVDDEDFVKILKFELFKEYIPSIDWGRYERIYKECLSKFIEDVTVEEEEEYSGEMKKNISSDLSTDTGDSDSSEDSSSSGSEGDATDEAEDDLDDIDLDI